MVNRLEKPTRTDNREKEPYSSMNRGRRRRHWSSAFPFELGSDKGIGNGKSKRKAKENEGIEMAEPVRKRKSPTVTPKLSAARAQSAGVLKSAWARAKGAGKKRPDATDIAAARTSLGLPAKGTSTH